MGKNSMDTTNSLMNDLVSLAAGKDWALIKSAVSRLRAKSYTLLQAIL